MSAAETYTAVTTHLALQALEQIPKSGLSQMEVASICVTLGLQLMAPTFTPAQMAEHLRKIAAGVVLHAQAESAQKSPS